MFVSFVGYMVGTMILILIDYFTQCLHIFVTFSFSTFDLISCGSFFFCDLSSYFSCQIFLFLVCFCSSVTICHCCLFSTYFSPVPHPMLLQYFAEIARVSCRYGTGNDMQQHIWIHALLVFLPKKICSVLNNLNKHLLAADLFLPNRYDCCQIT